MSDDDIPVRRGNTLLAHFLCHDEENQPFPLDGAEFRIQLGRQSPPVPLIKSTADPDSGLTLDAEAGIVSLVLTAAETRSLKPGRVGRYELEYVGNGMEVSVKAGFLKVEEGMNSDG